MESAEKEEVANRVAVRGKAGFGIDATLSSADSYLTVCNRHTERKEEKPELKHRVRSIGMIVLAALLLPSLAMSAESSPDPASAEAEDASIRATIQRYITGTSYNRIELTRSAFHQDAELFLSHPDKEIWIVPIEEYLEFFADREEGKFNGREGKILAVDRSKDIATAKAEISSTRSDARYIDIFLLKKVAGEWLIISKAATRTQ